VERPRPEASLRETVASGAVRVADLMVAVGAAAAAEVAAVEADRVGIHPIGAKP
jgi:hypothetical protein